MPKRKTRPKHTPVAMPKRRRRLTSEDIPEIPTGLMNGSGSPESIRRCNDLRRIWGHRAPKGPMEGGGEDDASSERSSQRTQTPQTHQTPQAPAWAVQCATCRCAASDACPGHCCRSCRDEPDTHGAELEKLGDENMHHSAARASILRNILGVQCPDVHRAEARAQLS